MTLPTANIIRTMRREKNVTQDELAQALGVSYQAVSRWENGQAYPDIELLPKIAAFFGITTDRLLGADKEAKIQKRIRTLHAYNEAYRAAEDGFGKYEIMSKAAAEFPDVLNFTEAALNELVYHNALPRNEALPIVREYCRKIIETTEKPTQRLTMLYMIFRYEDEDKLDDWNRYISGYRTIPQLLASRYEHLGEGEKCNYQRQKNLYDSLSYAFEAEFSRYQSEPVKDTIGFAEGQETILRLIDVLRDTSTDEDAWIFRRAAVYLRLAACRFCSGDKERGYRALEESVRLHEMIFRFPENKELSFHTPVLDRLKIPVKSYLSPKDNNFITSKKVVFNLIYPVLTGAEDWKWFESVSREQRFQELTARIAVYQPEK